MYALENNFIYMQSKCIKIINFITHNTQNKFNRENCNYINIKMLILAKETIINK